tara:strand:+ start:13486 stop:13764 length:279 start_codon:yes stop_codon:yes gene_type:complete
MALRHGNKTYLQILLDPHRAKLVMQLANKEGIRATAWIRNAVYKELERSVQESEYRVAEAKDEAQWRESVLRRVQGRTSQQINENEASAEMP